MTLKLVPEIGKTYHYFDDGKIKPTRHYYIEIDAIYTFDEAPKEIKEWAISDIEECQSYNPFLYAKTTDFIVKGHFKDNPEELQWFIRRTNGGWFSLGNWFSGELDVDGSIFKQACETYNMTPEEFLIDSNN